MYILVLLACIFVHDAVVAQSNITVDDSAKSIVYSAGWGLSAPSPLDYGGSHHLSGDQSAFATFTFTGVAVYYLSPKWPYSVNTQLSLDGGPGEVVDLVDHSSPTTGGGAETVAYSAVWGKTGLANTQHQLVASMAPGGQFVVVDGFIYTTVGSSGTTSSPSGTSSSSSSPSSTNHAPSSASPASTSDASSHQSQNSKLIVPIAGAAAGVVGIVALAALLLLCCRRLRDRKRRESSLKATARGSPSAQGSIRPESSFHFSQPGAMSPAPSVITTNLAGYGAFQQMPPLPEERNYPASDHTFAARPPEMHSAYYPAGANVDPARSAMRTYASDPAIGSNVPNAPVDDPRALYQMRASPISRLSAVEEGSAPSGASTNARTSTLSSLGGRSADYGYHSGIPPAMAFETRSTSTSSSYPSTSGSKGYTGREHSYEVDQKGYMSDQKTFTSSPQPSRVLSPAPPAYSASS